MPVTTRAIPEESIKLWHRFSQRVRACARTVTRQLRALWIGMRRVTGQALHSRKAWAAGLALIALLTVNALSYERYLATSDRSPETYPLLALDEHRRLLILAPHCDDEVLGAGGLVQAALRRDMDVRVVIATAGDGYRRATIAQFGHAFLRSEHFIAMGKLRQQESLDALARLGLHASDVTFLTYPERGLSALWWDYWRRENPYRSPYSGREQSPYPRAFHPGAPHSGEALLSDLRTILATDRPDLIVIPHPNDEHADHRILSAFIALAVEMQRAEDPTFQPRLLGYLVHYGLYPQPFGLKPGRSLHPPRQLEAVGEWVQWYLSVDELAAKRAALKAYRSQQRVLGYFLNTFVRQNELFMEMDEPITLGIVEGEILYDTDGIPQVPDDVIPPRRDDPVNDSVIRRISGGADITGLRVLRFGDCLWVGLETRQRVSRNFSYHLYIRAITPKDAVTWSGYYGRASTDGVTAIGHTIWSRIDLDTLGHPDWVIISAETRQTVVLDQTAWYLIHLEYNPLDELANLSVWGIMKSSVQTRDG